MPPEIAQVLQQVRGWISRQPRSVLAASAAGLLVGGWILYVPPLLAIQRFHRQWIQLDQEVREMRAVTDQVRQKRLSPPSSLDNLPTVLEEINALGRSKEIQLLQVTPGVAQPSQPQGLVILPVELYLEGGYRPLGEFLGALSHTPALGAVIIRRLSMERQERLLPHLRARISLELAFSEPADRS